MSKIGELIVLVCVALPLVVFLLFPVVSSAVQSVPQGMPDSGVIKVLIAEPVLDITLVILGAIAAIVVGMLKSGGFR